MATGQVARKFFGDVALFTLGSTALLGVAKNATIRVVYDMQESRAAKDGWRYRITKVAQWDVDFSTCVEDLASTYMGLAGTQVAVDIKTAATGVGARYTGNAVIMEATHELPDDAQTITWKAEGQGTLTLAST